MAKYYIADYMEVLARRGRNKQTGNAISRATMIPATTIHDWINGKSAPSEAAGYKEIVKRWGPEAAVRRYEEETGTKVLLDEPTAERRDQTILIKLDSELMELLKELLRILR